MTTNGSNGDAEIPIKNIPGIENLQDELDRANVVEYGELPENVIAIDSTARFVDDCTSDQYEITLVYPGQGRRCIEHFRPRAGRKRAARHVRRPVDSLGRFPEDKNCI